LSFDSERRRVSGAKKSRASRLNDFTHAPDGFLRVWNDYAKRGKYRETPISEELASSVRTISYDPDAPIVDVEPNSIYRWVKRTAERRYAATDDEGWAY